MNKSLPSCNLISVIALVGVLSLLSACGSDDENAEARWAQLANAGALSTMIHSSSSSSAPSPTALVEPSSEVVNPPRSSPSVILSTVSSSRSSVSVSSTGSLAAIKDITAPTAPANLKKAKILSQSATVSWAAATDNNVVVGYRVYRNGTQVAEVGGTTFSFTDAKLKPDTTYSYTLRAGDAEGNWSAVSSTLKLKTLIVSSDVTIEWFVPTARENGDYLEIAEIGGYEIRYKLSSQNQFKSVFIKSGDADKYQLGYLEGDYEFQIATYDTNGLYSEFVAIKPN